MTSTGKMTLHGLSVLFDLVFTPVSCKSLCQECENVLSCLYYDYIYMFMHAISACFVAQRPSFWGIQRIYDDK